MSLPEFDAIVLTGGRGRRMGGADKGSLVVDGVPLAHRVVAAVAGATRVVVAGPVPAGLEREVVAGHEEPPGGGPAAAVAAGLAHVTAGRVVVLATDLPFVDAAAVAHLVAAVPPSGGVALAVDGSGRDQFLLSAWATSTLRDALREAAGPGPAGAAGLPAHRVLAAARPVVRVSGLGPADGPPPWLDCDTPGDLAAARRWAQGGGQS
jgi:molybdenum cofactor guanylyltransferase